MYIIKKENVKKEGKMLYNYEFIETKPKLNKKKVFFVVLLVLVIIALAIYSAMQLAKQQHEKQLAIQQAKQLEEARLEEQRKQEAERAREQQKREEQLAKNTNPFTEEQMQAVENIYQAQEKKRVFLTFDDGPTQAVTPYILDLLKKEEIKATFFVLGNRAKANPELIRREFEEGHYIANHGYTHKYSQIYQNNQTVIDEYNYTEQCIQEALGNPDYHSKVFRFPGGSQGGYYNAIKKEAKQYLRQNGIVSLDWNCLSKDAEGAKTKEELLQNVINTMGQKQSVVILMHDAADKILTYETLPDVIQYLRNNDYEFKTLYDIL